MPGPQYVHAAHARGCLLIGCGLRMNGWSLNKAGRVLEAGVSEDTVWNVVPDPGITRAE